MKSKTIAQGAGLGFRRELLDQMDAHSNLDIDFFEIAPENWMAAGGRYNENLKRYTEKYPFVCHGLSLSIGSADTLDVDLLKSIKQFMAEHKIETYTEHLSWCSFDGHLYDLLPIPFTYESAIWVAERVKQAQDILERKISLENSSYYFSPSDSHLSEAEFINTIVAESGCGIHLDVNNVYVNSQNLKYDPLTFIESLPLDQVNYLHVAGHYVEDDGFIVDTHGADVIDPVWQLLEQTYARIGSRASTLPTCLERDFNFPGMNELLAEVNQIRVLQNKFSTAPVINSANN